MAAFMSHPSVRIKGTENNFEPIVCAHPKCADRPPHMHCPFCVKTEAYPDPVILKAHYRVKHVDKGLDFAGLKILRCCDHCDIVGTIKGEKKFKGPHWHCYKCRNGFNRRDEAIKHYRTHFRNPQTTFQIQVAQEVNIMLNNLHSTESDEAVDNLGEHSDFGLHGSLADGYYGEQFSSQMKTDTSAQVAANETVDGSDAQTIMIIQDRESQADEYNKERLLLQSDQQPYEELIQQKMNLERHVENLEANLKLAEMTRTENERLRLQNSALTQKVEQLSEELRTLKEISGETHRNSINELIDRLSGELQSSAKRILLEQVNRVRVETNRLLSDGASSPVNNSEVSVQTDSKPPNNLTGAVPAVDSSVAEPKPKRTRTTKS